MRKLLTLLIIALMGITLSACGKTIQDDTVSVVFYTSGAELIPTIYGIEKGSKIQKPKDPIDERDGIPVRTFLAWYKDFELTEEWDFDVDTVEKSITLYAKWDYVVYTIEYDLQGGFFPEDLPDGTYPTEFTIVSERLFLKPPFSGEWPVHPEKGRFIGWWEHPNLTAEQRRDVYHQVTTIEPGSYGNKKLYAYYR